MPEFILNTDNASPAYDALDDFAKGFIEALFFTEQAASDYTIANWLDDETQRALTEGQAGGSIPSDAGVAHLHPDAIAKVKRICDAFQAKARDLLALAYERDGYDMQRAGNDYLYTSQGHGTGYWDRAELDSGGLCDQLSELARYHEIGVFFDGESVHVD